MISVTTDSVSIRERAEFWTDLVSRHVTPMRIEPTSAHALRGEIRAQGLGDAGIARVAGAGVRALHTRTHVGRAGDHLHALCVHLAGQAKITRRGKTIALQT